MKLIEVVQQLATLDSAQTIYVRQPWSQLSEAKVAVEGSEEEKKIRGEGLSYFLEIFIARDFIDDWRKTQKRLPTDDQSCARLIEYATNDA